MSRVITFLLFAIVPGLLAFALVRYVISPPTQYVVQPPDTRAMQEAEKVVHRRSQSAEAANPLGEGRGSGERGFAPSGGSGDSGRAWPREGGPSGGPLPGPGSWSRGDGAGRPPSGTGSRPSTGGRPPTRPDGEGSSSPATGGTTPAPGGSSVFALIRLFSGIGRLEDTVAPLTSAQATDILAVMKPVRTMETLSPDVAAGVTKKLEALLTANQRTVIAESSSMRPGGGRPGGGDSGGRPPRGGGDVENMNPFNPSPDNPMAQRMAERYTAIFAALEAKANQ